METTMTPHTVQPAEDGPRAAVPQRTNGTRRHVFAALGIVCALVGATCGRAEKTGAPPKDDYPPEVVPTPELWGAERVFVSPGGRFVAGHSVPREQLRSEKSQSSVLIDLKTRKVTPYAGIVIGAPADDGSLCVLRNGEEVVASTGNKLELRGLLTADPPFDIYRIVATPRCGLVVLEARTPWPTERSTENAPAGIATEIIAFGIDGKVRWRHQEYWMTIASTADIAISTGGALVAYATEDGIVVADALTGELRYQHSDPALTYSSLRFEADQNAVLAFTDSTLWRLDLRPGKSPERFDLEDSFDAFAEGKPGDIILLRSYLTHGSQLAMPSWVCILSKLSLERGATKELWRRRETRCMEVLARLPDGRVLFSGR